SRSIPIRRIFAVCQVYRIFIWEQFVHLFPYSYAAYSGIKEAYGLVCPHALKIANLHKKTDSLESRLRNFWKIKLDAEFLFYIIHQIFSFCHQDSAPDRRIKNILKTLRFSNFLDGSTCFFKYRFHDIHLFLFYIGQSLLTVCLNVALHFLNLLNTFHVLLFGFTSRLTIILSHFSLQFFHHRFYFGVIRPLYLLKR